MSKRIAGYMIALFVFATITSGCIQSRNQVTETHRPRGEWLDRWLTHPACEPPCWENITPGVTSLDDAGSILLGMNDVEINYWPENADTARQMSWVFEPGSDSGTATTDKDGKVISNIFLGLNSALSLEDIVAAYGDPTKVLLYDCRAELGTKRCEVHIIFRDLSMAVGTRLINDVGKDSHMVDINKDVQIGRIWFLPSQEESYENMIGKNSFDYPEFYFDWKGYGNYP